ncbi:MAG: hypothetical protein ABI564_05175 [Ideonella sp.]
MRSHFLLDPTVVFLNHGSFGACPIELLEVRRQWEHEMERNPVEFLGRRSAALLLASREALGKLIGARAEHQSILHAPVTSWGYLAGDGGHTGFDGYTGRSIFERRMQWQGTRDISACLTVPAAIDWLRAHDWNVHRSRCHQQAIALMHRVCAGTGLQPIARDGDFVQMVAIPVPHRDAAGLRQTLFDQHRIEVPVTQHDGQILVRVSVQAYNSEADLQALADALMA